MKKHTWGAVFVLGIVFLLSMTIACNSSDDTAKKIQAVTPTQAPTTLPVPEGQKANETAPPLSSADAAKPAESVALAKTITTATVIAEVDGAKLTRGQLDTEVKKNMAALGGKVPLDRMAEVTSKVRLKIVDDFIVRTLLSNEVKRLKIEVTEKEIEAAMNDLKNSLPSGVTMEEMMKKNAMTPEKVREEVALGIRINKLVAMQPAGKASPTEKEVNAFYKANPDKFKMPESVHARHILVAKVKGADDAAKAKQKEKAEDFRKQLLAGADFSEMAKTHSDCPSKAKGGDLGTFSKGQMVKPFEDAAFTQKKNEIGPVIETDFGYHIIQVVDHHQPRVLPLDQTAKAQITSYLQQQKRYEAFKGLMKSLKDKAKITVTEKID